MINFGEVPANSVLPIPFPTYDANGASVTMTGFALADIRVYKGTSMTQRSVTNGIVLLDTDGTDIDAVTGLQGFSIDLSDNNDAGFYAVGSFYYVVVSTVTISAQTVTFIAATFRIKAAEVVTGMAKVDIGAIDGVAGNATVLGKWTSQEVSGTADSGTTTTMVDAARVEADTDYFKNCILLITSGNLAQQARRILSFDVPNHRITVSPAFTQAVSTHDYAILPDAGVDVIEWNGTVVAVPTVSGIPKAEVASVAAAAAVTIADEVQTRTIAAVTAVGSVVGAIGSLAAQAKADVNAEVVDALATDTYAEPGQGTPPATSSIAAKIGYLFKAFVNKSEQTANAWKGYNNAGAVVDQKMTTSDDGVTFTKDNTVSGP